jgi:hypothetical protein
MKYYFLNYPWEKKIIGKYPQSNIMNYSLEFAEMYLQMESESESGKDWNKLFLDYDLQLSISIATKLTSFLNCVEITRGLVISTEAFPTIQEFKLPIYKTLNASLFIQKKKPVDISYCWFHAEPVSLELIDFGKSSFSTIQFIGDLKLKEHKPNNSEELKKIVDQHPHDLSTFLMPKELFLKSDFQFDLFRFEFFDRGRYLVSERLKNKMLEEGFTGMEFKEPKDFKITRLTE